MIYNKVKRIFRIHHLETEFTNGQMNRLPALVFFLFLFTSTGWAQTWTRMQSWGLDFESVHWISDKVGVGVGERLIFQTTNGGTTWEEVIQKFDTHFFDVVFLNTTNGIAVGDKGVVYVTIDGGKTWQKKESGTTNDLLNISQTSGSEVVAVGKNGEIRTSTDFGNTWSKVNSGTSLHLNDIAFVNQNTAFIAADDGRFLRSFDKGKTWSISNLTQTLDLYGVAFSSELIGYLVGENGIFHRTIDGGQTWTSLNSTTTTTLRKVAISPLDGRIVIGVGDLGTIVRSANSGTTFGRINLGANATRKISNTSFKPNSNEQVAIGKDGYLLFSSNAGTSWTQRLAGIRNHFSSVDFKTQTIGFIAGQSGNFFVTTNSATTLISRPLPEPIGIETIDFWNTSFGYTSSPQGKIYRTGNSGSAWVPVFNTPTRTVMGFYLFAPSVIYAAGSQGYITRSFDSGVTWDQAVVSNTTANLKDVTFFDFVFGFAIGDNGQISWSAGGNSWENLPKLTTENLNALAKLDTARALVVGNKGVILKTEDKARTWRKIESGTTKNLRSVDFFNDQIGFISGDEGLALVTLDGGETWLNSPTGTVRNLTAVSAGTDRQAYFVGEDGTVISYTCIPPTGTLGTITGDAQSCISSTVYSINESPQPGSQIIWRVDGGQIISGQGTNQIEVRWTTSGRNAVLVSRTNFCGSGETSALEVAVSQPPTINQTVSGEGSTCIQKTNTYAVPNFEGVTYTWAATGGEVTKGQGSNQVEIRWNQSGQQLLTVVQANRCGQTEPIRKTVVVNAAPNQPSAIIGDVQIGFGEQIYEVERVPGLDYRWSLSSAGGKIISGQGTSKIVILWEKEGDYELTVDAQNECNFGPKRSLAINVNIITSLEPVPDHQLKVYPNPSQGWLILESPLLDNWTGVEVFNPLGQMVQHLDIVTGMKKIRLDGLPRGMLLIQLNGAKGRTSRRVLVR